MPARLDPLASGVSADCAGRSHQNGSLSSRTPAKSTALPSGGARPPPRTIREGEIVASSRPTGPIEAGISGGPDPALHRHASIAKRRRPFRRSRSAARTGLRSGPAPARPAVIGGTRPIDIHRLVNWPAMDDADHADVRSRDRQRRLCPRPGAGYRRRAWAVFGHICAPCDRISPSGNFTLKTPSLLDFDGATGRYSERLSEHVLPIETTLDDIPALALTADEAQRMRSGQAVGLFTHHHRDWLAEIHSRRTGRPGIALALWQGQGRGNGADRRRGSATGACF